MKRNWQILGWATVLLSGAVLELLHGVEERQEIQRVQRNGRIAEGVVTHAEKGWKSRDDGEPPYIEYKFSVSGREYTGAAGLYIPKGDSVQVKYSASNPKQNFAADDNGTFQTVFFMALLLGGGGILTGMLGYSEATARLVIRENSAAFEAKPFIHLPIILVCVTFGYLLFGGTFHVVSLILFVTPFVVAPLIQEQRWTMRRAIGTRGKEADAFQIQR